MESQMSARTYTYEPKADATVRPEQSVKERFIRYIEKNNPTIKGRVILNRQLILRICPRMTSQLAHHILLDELKEYLGGLHSESFNFYSFVCIFTREDKMDEQTFENKLRHLLNSLRKLDHCETEIRFDPETDQFRFGLFGNTFYVVGLHPDSSDSPRQSPWVSIVFNLRAG